MLGCAADFTACAGSTAGLQSKFGGKGVAFEWSNIGAWEALALPDGMEYLTMRELIAGLDGHWHIIYKDFLTDRIKCWSTL